MARSKKRSPKNAKLGRAVGERIAEVAQEKGLSTTQLAARIGVKASQISAWRNDGSVPGGFYLAELSKALGVTTDWLLNIEGAPKYRGLRMDHDEMNAEIFQQAMQMWGAGFPRLMPEGLEVIWRPIEDVMRRNLKEEWGDPETVLREFYGTHISSPDEKRCLLTAMLALAFQDARHRHRHGGVASSPPAPASGASSQTPSVGGAPAVQLGPPTASQAFGERPPSPSAPAAAGAGAGWITARDGA